MEQILTPLFFTKMLFFVPKSENCLVHIIVPSVLLILETIGSYYIRAKPGEYGGYSSGLLQLLCITIMHVCQGWKNEIIFTFRIEESQSTQKGPYRNDNRQPDLR